MNSSKYNVQGKHEKGIKLTPLLQIDNLRLSITLVPPSEDGLVLSKPSLYSIPETKARLVRIICPAAYTWFIRTIVHNNIWCNNGSKKQTF